MKNQCGSVSWAGNERQDRKCQITDWTANNDSHLESL